MIALAALEYEEDLGGGLLRWLVPASFALHVAVFAELPSTTRAIPMASTPLVLEVAEPPPEAIPIEPPPKADAPLSEPSPATALRRPLPASPRVAHASPMTGAAPVTTTPTFDDAPMDFTSTVLSNEGPGHAGASGAGLPSTGSPVATAPRSAPLAPVPPRVVPPSSLARRPRAPGLDDELERQYPIEARRAGISGSAVLRVRILPDGRIGGVHVASESWKGFGVACERTVRAAHWEPPIDRDGTPVATEITYTCRFEVRS
jgi:protein TonB